MTAVTDWREWPLLANISSRRGGQTFSPASCKHPNPVLPYAWSVLDFHQVSQNMRARTIGNTRGQDSVSEFSTTPGIAQGLGNVPVIPYT